MLWCRLPDGNSLKGLLRGSEGSLTMFPLDLDSSSWTEGRVTPVTTLCRAFLHVVLITSVSFQTTELRKFTLPLCLLGLYLRELSEHGLLLAERREGDASDYPD